MDQTQLSILLLLSVVAEVLKVIIMLVALAKQENQAVQVEAPDSMEMQ
jgi:hypothetical protein